MIKEVLVVEGKSDIRRVQQFVDVECIATEGYTLRKAVLEQIRVAYEKRGIIILTDPDSPGERIRKVLSKKFPLAKHAFVPKEEAFANEDVGIEQAGEAAILKALAKVHTEQTDSSNLFTMIDLFQHDLSGSAEAAQRRDRLGGMLGIGYGNSKRFLYRLNHYGIRREEFEAAIASL